MKIGKIISVEYDKFRVRLFHSTKTSTISIDGQVYYFGNIGSYLKTYNSVGDAIVCEVVAVVDYSMDSKIYSEFNLDSSRELVIKPIGTLPINGEFSMGVGIFPSLYNDVDIVTVEDVNKILALTNNEENSSDTLQGIHKTIEIGYSKNLINYKIALSINSLFNIHTAVLGNSGSGKSNTIAHILQDVYRKSDNHAVGAKTIVFDVNGEYPCAFKDSLNNKIEHVFYKPNIGDDFEDSGIKYKKFVLPYYLMTLDEWLAFLMASERTQKPFWDKVLQECYKFYKIFNIDNSENKEVSDEFANYIKWKVRNFLLNILSHIESDTTKMTAARGVISQIREVCEEMSQKIEDDVKKDLSNYLNACNNLCIVCFGSNNDSLSKSLPSFIQKGKNRFVSLKENKDNKNNITGYEAKENDTPVDGSFSQIDENKAIKTNNQKLNDGAYFDYKFLKTAVNVILLEEEAQGNVRIREFTSTLLSRLDFFINNPECAFMREISNKYRDKDDYLKEVFGIELNKQNNQLIIVDSSEVSPDILELLTSVVGRMIFDFRKRQRGENRRKCPIHLILDEAHRYIKKDVQYILKENIFEKIAREGRKYSLYLLISSQRPSELSSTVLSQCGNYIVHRIQNEVDIKYIYSVLPYFSEDYISKIKQAIPGEALIFGNCVPMPLLVKVTQANPDPNSKNCVINREWFTINTNQCEGSPFDASHQPIDINNLNEQNR